MFQRVSLALLLSGASSLLVRAAEAATGDSQTPEPFLYTAQTILLVLGMAYAAYRASAAFNAPPISLGDYPTPPRYMTQPSQYRLGAILFVTLCLVVYALIAYFNKEFLPLVEIISPELYKIIEKSTTDGSLPYPLVVIFAAAIFVALLGIDKDWNPLLLLRRVVHSWVSIPDFADKFMIAAREALVVPDEARAKVAADLDTPFVAVGDFDKARGSLDRRWAELCYVRRWLARHHDQGLHLTFFGEPSFGWEQLQIDYANARARITPLKQGQQNDAGTFAEVAALIETLRRKYCRLAACFLVFKNQTRTNALSDARQFGVTIEDELNRANPLRYIVIFTVAIMVAIYCGVTLSAAGWDLFHPTIAATFVDDSDLVTRWMGFALANYGMPIAAVLLLRYLDWRVDPGQPNSYLITYATIFLLALAVSTPSLAGAVKLIGSPQAASVPYYTLLLREFKWAISPALVTVYVAYHVDRQIDPMLPDIGSDKHWRPVQRLLNCVLLGLIVTLLSVGPTLSMSLPQGYPWPIEKLRIVVLGTTFIIGLVMALIGEFFLIKPAPAEPAAPMPAAMA